MGDQFKPGDDKSSAGPPPPLTPEELASLPHNDEGPNVLAALWVLTGISACFLGLRIYCKILSKRPLWWDDHLLVASWICLLVDSACWTVVIARYGFGKHSWDIPLEDFPSMVPLMITAGTFILISVIWSKTSFAFTLLRLVNGWMKVMVWVLILATNLSLGLSAVFNFVSCTPIQKSWNPMVEGKCWDARALIDYHIFAAVVSAFADIALSLLPWKLLWNLQMKRREKLGIGLAISMGIFAGITSIIKAANLPTMMTNDIQDVTIIVHWGAAEAAATIIAASIPVLRILVREMKSSVMGERSRQSNKQAKTYFSANKTTLSGIRRTDVVTVDHQSQTSILDKSENGNVVAMKTFVTSRNSSPQSPV